MAGAGGMTGTGLGKNRGSVHGGALGSVQSGGSVHDRLRTVARTGPGWGKAGLGARPGAGHGAVPALGAWSGHGWGHDRGLGHNRDQPGCVTGLGAKSGPSWRHNRVSVRGRYRAGGVTGAR